MDISIAVPNVIYCIYMKLVFSTAREKFPPLKVQLAIQRFVSSPALCRLRRDTKASVKQ